MILGKITVLVSALILSSMTFAAADDVRNCPNDGKSYKECKQARSNDRGAKRYLLMSSGQLLRVTDDNRLKCTIDQDVLDIKVSIHPTDAAVVYYTKSGRGGKQLIAVKNVDGDFAGQCVKVQKSVLMENVKEFSVVPNRDTTIVNAALSRSGQLKAWDSRNEVYSDYGIVDYQINSCFGQSGRAFNSYALFTIDKHGIVTKVKGNGGRYVKDKADNSRFQSIKQFIEVRNVCN
jgi:hypothetical protein